MTPARQEERSLGELLSEVTNELSTLFRKELELAKTEIKEQVSEASKAGAMFAGTAVAAYLALLLLSMAAAFGLAEVMPTGAAFLIVGVVHAIVAAVLFSVARKRISNVSPVPAQTMQTVKADVQTARSSIQAGANSNSGSEAAYSSWNRSSYSS